MISTIFCELALIFSIVATTSCITSPLLRACSWAPVPSALASSALCAFCLTVAVNSSIDAAVSSRPDACSSVRCERFALPSAISPAAVATCSTAPLICITVPDSSSVVVENSLPTCSIPRTSALYALASVAGSSLPSTLNGRPCNSTFAVRSPAASLFIDSTSAPTSRPITSSMLPVTCRRRRAIAPPRSNANVHPRTSVTTAGHVLRTLALVAAGNRVAEFYEHRVALGRFHARLRGQRRPRIPAQLQLERAMFRATEARKPRGETRDLLALLRRGVLRKLLDLAPEDRFVLVEGRAVAHPVFFRIGHQIPEGLHAQIGRLTPHVTEGLDHRPRPFHRLLDRRRLPGDEDVIDRERDQREGEQDAERRQQLRANRQSIPQLLHGLALRLACGRRAEPQDFAILYAPSERLEHAAMMPPAG